MSLQKSDSNNKPRTQTGFLVQQNNTLSGTLNFPGPVPGCCCAGVGPAAGSVNGENVTLTITPVGLAFNLTGTVGSDPGSMSGTYITLSQGCINPNIVPETGTWIGTKVNTLNGGFQGTFTAFRTNVGQFPVSGQVGQAANNGSSAPLSGSLNASGYCFSASTLTGTISGTSVVLNLVDSQGGQIGQVMGTVSTDGKSFTGTYAVLAQSERPCIQGDRGTVSLSF